MSQEAPARSLWLRHGSPAPERLRKAVADLTRARRLQVLVDHGFGGLLVGLGLATVAVLVARLVPSPYPPWQLAGAAVIIALGVALLAGWQRRPDALEVAIRADLALNLKQRLSTAWEFMTVHGEGELADRLAAQAVKAGLSTRPAAVFPFRVNHWGRLAPLAATALLLVSVIELNGMQAPAPHEVDEQVVGEGRRLGAFGRAMQERAQRGELPRSARQAAQLERLGARMESGALSRGQALGDLRQVDASLDEERMRALAEANQTDIGPLRAENEERSPIALDRADTRARAPGERLDDLGRSGIPRREAEDALRHHQAGADDAVKEVVERLARIDRAQREDTELRSALEQVRRAQENLGEPLAGTDGGRGTALGMEWDEDEDRGVKGAANASMDARRDSASTFEVSRAAPQARSSVATDRRHSPLRPDPGHAGPVLIPRGQVREGEAFVSQGRILPRPGRPSVERLAMSSEFASQVEEVLSHEQYPAHYKEYIRRYFLNLSQGVRAPQQQPPGTRGAP